MKMCDLPSRVVRLLGQEPTQEDEVIEALKHGPLSINDLAAALDTKSKEMNALIHQMAHNGLVQFSGEGKYFEREVSLPGAPTLEDMLAAVDELCKGAKGLDWSEYEQLKAAWHKQFPFATWQQAGNAMRRMVRRLCL